MTTTKYWRIQKLSPGKRIDIALYEDYDSFSKALKEFESKESKDEKYLGHSFDIVAKDLHKDLKTLLDKTKTANETIKRN